MSPFSHSCRPGVSEDGCAGAPSGAPQYPSLLDGYGNHRPPWDVAGVDYHVGIPAGTTLTDWQAIDDPNVTLNPGNGMVRCTGAGAAVLFDKIDFSLHGGAYIFNGSGGCSAITVTNSNFACPITAPSFTFIQDQNGASVTVRSSNFTVTAETAGPPPVLQAGSRPSSPYRMPSCSTTGST